jgi:hypothetical protein
VTRDTDRGREGMRRAVVGWSLAFLLLVAAFAGTVAALNSTVYSAGGFVRAYLDALARQDSRAALDLPGVTVPDTGSRDLLNGVARGELEDVRELGEQARPDGTRAVRFGYAADGVTGTTTFEVRRTGARFLLFDTWEFAVSPVSELDVTVSHASTFTANGLVVETADEPRQLDGTGVTPYLVFAPAVYTVGHESRYLQADEEPVLVDTPGSTVPVTVAPRPNQVFVDQVQKELDAYLAECASQRVLQPAGCPFGQTVRDRIQGEPEWTIAESPRVTLQPFTADPGDQAWLVPETTGAAHIVVDVRSIFDGRVTRLDQDVPFSVSYRVVPLADGSLRLEAL